VDNEGSRLLLLTDRRAPNRRLVLVDPSDSRETHWVDVIPEQAQPLDAVIAIGEVLFAVHRQDGAHRLSMYNRGGVLCEHIALPSVGSVRLGLGSREDSHAFWTFTTFTSPPSIFRYEIQTQTPAVIADAKLPFEAHAFRTEHVRYPSSDGTLIPMFIVRHERTSLDRLQPLLLHVYGGNGASIGPSFDPLLIALVERGVIYALACVRGGGEYGEAWHHAGQQQRKQRSFDDCIAGAEWLHAHGYSTPERSAILGTSNGGLTVGAVMSQRPDLFAVALPQAAILDMLRFQKFTCGWTWVPEYGSSDDPDMFSTLLGYSPLHNIEKGIAYPATLIVTNEHDECVVPAHSYKFAATLQERGAGSRPYLIHVHPHSGHGPPSLRAALEERADLYAFFLTHTADGGQGDALPDRD